jgi:pimeloyl-ACP methyl ester carboxylesterase
MPLPRGIRSRQIQDVNGLAMHVLEAGFEKAGRPCLLLLHGFPELAYSWRKIMVPLADAGFYVVAPDQRGYGRTTGWDTKYDGDLASFGLLNLVRDCLALLNALGRNSVEAVIGHDFGSHVAAHCALIRPDVFKSAVLMSAPFQGTPEFPSPAPSHEPDIHADLAALARPRKHYQWYYSTRAANADMVQCPQGVHDFMRAYYHSKSADWPGNAPYPLKEWTVEELEKLPAYYIMDLDQGMPETAAQFMPETDEISACVWLPDAELAFYTGEFTRTGFQGGLQWYRCATGLQQDAELRLFAGRTIDVPACFIAGDKDWGVFQKPDAFEAMQERACSNFFSATLIPGAGHWVQQEQSKRVVQALLEFLSAVKNG